MKSIKFCNEVDGLLFCFLEIGNFVKFSFYRFILLILFLDLIFSLKEKLFYNELYKIFEGKNFRCIENLYIERLVECLFFDIDFDLFCYNIY